MSSRKRYNLPPPPHAAAGASSIHKLAMILTRRYGGRAGIVSVISFRRGYRLVVTVVDDDTAERRTLLQKLREEAKGVPVEVRRGALPPKPVPPPSPPERWW